MTRAKVLRAKAAMADRDTDVSALAGELGVTRQTLYRHVGPGGEVRADGQKLMTGGRHRKSEPEKVKAA